MDGEKVKGCQVVEEEDVTLDLVKEEEWVMDVEVVEVKAEVEDNAKIFNFYGNKLPHI